MAESRRLATIPRRPAWRDSDPRWRRRMLIGAWLLVLLPLMEALNALGWASKVPVPTVFDFPGALRLDETLLSCSIVYQPLVFCIGVVLLFSKERGRRPGPLDWTRRWGVICSYIVFLLSAVQVLFVVALVLLGISALFLSMPLKHQPGVTQLFVHVSTAYLRYGPYPREISALALIAFASVTILLACFPLFDALRSSGPKPLAAILLAPLALFSLAHLAQVGWYCLGFPGVTSADFWFLGPYFRPQMLVGYIAGDQWYLNILPRSFVSSSAVVVEATKWCIVLAIAVWMSVARLAAWRSRRPRITRIHAD